MSNEALIRVEYKLDLIIHALQHAGLMLSHLPLLSEIELDICPLCRTSNRLLPDYGSGTLSRQCSCRLPVSVVPGINSLTQLKIDKKEVINEHSEDSTGPSDG